MNLTPITLGHTMHGFILPAVSKLTVLALAVQPTYIDPVRVTVWQTEELTQTLDKGRVTLRPVLVRQNTFLVFCLQVYIHIYTQIQVWNEETWSIFKPVRNSYMIWHQEICFTNYLPRSNIYHTYFMSLVGMNVVQHLQSSSGGLQ